MKNNNKLKAFVRFDGLGRVVPSSLILQKSKPKVGNWKEIDANQCCNYSPSTTTTTTPQVQYTYYETNQYFCDNCSNVVGTGVIIKVPDTIQGIYIGSWLNDANSPNVQYNVLAFSSPNIYAAAINVNSISNNCSSC